jgi:hypothetical protein
MSVTANQNQGILTAGIESSGCGDTGPNDWGEIHGLANGTYTVAEWSCPVWSTHWTIRKAEKN